jgi:hypothetical protein
VGRAAVDAREWPAGMDSFAAYGSGSEDEEGEEPTTALPVPAWKEAADDSDDSQEEAGEPAETATPAAVSPAKRAQAGVGAIGEPPKKRKLLDPFAAMCAASASSSSFLSKQTADEETEAFSAVQQAAQHEACAAPAPERPSDRESVRAPAKQAVPAPAISAPRDEARKKEETVRQKNARKQKMGQANFTVKSNRECPDVWQGPS